MGSTFSGTALSHADCRFTKEEERTTRLAFLLVGSRRTFMLITRADEEACGMGIGSSRDPREKTGASVGAVAREPRGFL